MKIEESKVLVVGTGVSGIAAAELLLKKKIDTVLFDVNKELDLEKFYAKAPELKNVPMILGELTRESRQTFRWWRDFAHRMWRSGVRLSLLTTLAKAN